MESQGDTQQQTSASELKSLNASTKGTSTIHRCSTLLSALFIAFVTIGTDSAWGQQYVFRSIDVPGAAATVIDSNNNLGATVGCDWMTGFSSGRLGFLLSDGILKTVKYPGATDTCAEALSENGKIVGHYVDASGATHGLRWIGKTYSSFDYPGAVDTYGFGVNDSGAIIGFYFDGTGVHSFKLKSGVFTNLDPPGAAGSIANTINDSGQIVGYYSLTDPEVNSGRQGYLLSGGKYTSINYPGEPETIAEGLNNAGQVVGYYIDSSSVYHGFTDFSGTFSTLDYPGATDSFPAGVNEAGQIVGSWTGSSYAYDFHGFLASPIVNFNAPRGKSPVLHK
jgi:uncharacterized membrane protein